MDPIVVAVVLCAAIFNATWNVVLKVGNDRLVRKALFNGFAGLIALAILPFVEMPVAAAWPYILASIAIHNLASLFLVFAYEHSDLGRVYPIARGGAPLFTIIGAALVAGEWLAPFQWGAVALLAVGIMTLSLRRGGLPQDRWAAASALATALMITADSLVNGLGARVNGNAHSYVIWLFALDWVPLLMIAGWRRRGSFRTAVQAHWVSGVIGGALSLAAYWMVVWAMTQAPIGLVAALRETSVVFATLFAVVALRETVTRWQVLSIGLVLMGAVLLRVV